MINISEIHDCFGCGVCAISCPKAIIDIRLDRYGFYSPIITNDDACIKCGLCLKVCAYYNKEDKKIDGNPEGYATWSLNPEIRRTSSSGGTGYEIASYLIKRGYTFCGVRYNAEKGIAEHYFSENDAGLKQSTGSKYIQSYTVDSFKKLDFKNGKYVVVGTPCQIASLHRIITRKHAEDRFVLIDFFCHGVPSMLLWNKYCDFVENKIGKIYKASWRNKQNGWHDSWAMSMQNTDTEDNTNLHENINKRLYNSKMSQGDLFYKYFLGHHCLGFQCTSACHFKMSKSYADIRIGDLWGKTYENEDKGITGVLAITSKGKDIICQMSNIYKKHIQIDIVCEGQMKTNAHAHPLRPLTLYLMRSKLPLTTIDKIVSFLEFPLKVFRKLHIIKY